MDSFVSVIFAIIPLDVTIALDLPHVCLHGQLRFFILDFLSHLTSLVIPFLTDRHCAFTIH